MIQRTILSVFLFFITTPLFAQLAGASVSQNGVTPWLSTSFSQGYASTAAEGFMNGAARYLIAEGHYLESVGVFNNLMQNAHEKQIENFALRNRVRWNLIDERQSRYNASHPNYIARRNFQLDMMEEMDKLRERESKLKHPASSIKFNGKTFGSYQEFKASEEYKEFYADAWWRSLQDKVDLIEKQEKHQKAVEFEKNRRNYSNLTQQFMDEQNRHHKAVKSIMGYNSWKFPPKG